jgi:MFS family permease
MGRPWQLLPALAVAGAGMGIVMPSLFDFILAEVPQKDAGSASGVVNTVMQLGNAIGIAVIGVVFFGRVAASAGPAASDAAATLRSDLIAAGVKPETAETASAQLVDCFVARAAEGRTLRMTKLGEGELTLMRDYLNVLTELTDRHRGRLEPNAGGR